MARRKKEKSKTLNEVIRIKIQDKDIGTTNKLYLVDDKEEINKFPLANPLYEVNG